MDNDGSGRSPGLKDFVWVTDKQKWQGMVMVIDQQEWKY